jgi:hypothetical protein
LASAAARASVFSFRMRADAQPAELRPATHTTAKTSHVERFGALTNTLISLIARDNES